MKILTWIAILSFACIGSLEAQGPKKPKAKTMKPVMAYEAEYSSKFSLADDTYSAMVLDLWKDFEENDFERNKEYFSEDLVMEFADGEVLSGRDNIIESAKNYRSQMKGYSPTMTSYVSLKSDDQGENWVVVWGEDSHIDQNGATVKTLIHEIWRFNERGEIDFMRQYAHKPKE